MPKQRLEVAVLVAGLAGCHGVPAAPAPLAPMEPPPIATLVVPDVPVPSASASAAPDPAPPPTRIDEIALGAEHTCARTSAQEVYCWGDDQYGQLGDGGTVDRVRPTRLAAKGAVQIGAGNYYGCARLASGSVVCWGSRKKGEIGDGKQGDGFTTPVKVPGIDGARDLAVGEDLSCATASDSSVWCWGNDWRFGVAYHATPVEVPELRGVMRMGRADAQRCTQTEAGGPVRCLGDPRMPRLVGSLRAEVADVRAFSSDGFAVCAVTGGGALVCWGTVEYDGYSPQLQWPKPTVMPAPVRLAQVAVGGAHVCAVGEDGGVWCFGRNGEGQLGDGTQRHRLAMARVAGLEHVASVAAGEAHTCALTREGKLWCWGRNKNGQLGDGTRERRLVPEEIAW